MRRLLLPVAVAVLVFAVLGCVAAGTRPGAPAVDGSSAISMLALNVTQPVDESIVRSSPITVSGNTKDGADVMINGLSVAVESGHFIASVELEPGPNSIDVSVRDGSGKEASKYLTVLYVP